MAKFKRKIECSDTGEIADNYDKYLKTKHWKNKRLEILKRDNYICQSCGNKFTSSKLHVHHLTYEHIGNEDELELVTLCQECHNSIHSKNKKTKKKSKRERSLNNVKVFVLTSGKKITLAKKSTARMEMYFKLMSKKEQEKLLNYVEEKYMIKYFKDPINAWRYKNKNI